MNSCDESTIRDYLSKKLEILERGLCLIETEKYLPNPQGTRGFVDLFARDKSGKYVLIELKRSASASREALHEILKYLEAVKNKFSVRDSEIRIFIVSTVWSELIVPFSSFVQRVSCEVVGYSLEIDSNGMPTEAKVVSPIKLTNDRLFAPWHELNMYKSKESLADGVHSYEVSCNSKGIHDYVLIVMEADPEHHRKSIEKIKLIINDFLGGEDSNLTFDNEIPEIKYILYFATLQLEVEFCWSLIKNSLDQDDFENFETFVSELSDASLHSQLHTKIYDLEPRTQSDGYEIGYPAKFRDKLLDVEKWKIIKIIRYGTLKANVLLTDESIIDDLGGADGKSRQFYKNVFNSSVKSEIEEIKTGVKRCLCDNVIWRNQILRILDEFMPYGLNIEASLSIYNPANFCLALYRYIRCEDGNSYVPFYSLCCKNEEKPICLFLGVMMPTGESPSFSKIFNIFFDCDGYNFLENLTWGGYLSNDVDISLQAGMTYKTFKIDFTQETQSYWELVERGLQPCEPIHRCIGFEEFVKCFNDFSEDVINFYSSHWNGVFSEFIPNEEYKFKT